MRNKKNKIFWGKSPKISGDAGITRDSGPTVPVEATPEAICSKTYRKFTTSSKPIKILVVVTLGIIVIVCLVPFLKSFNKPAPLSYKEVTGTLQNITCESISLYQDGIVYTFTGGIPYTTTVDTGSYPNIIPQTEIGKVITLNLSYFSQLGDQGMYHLQSWSEVNESGNP